MPATSLSAFIQADYTAIKSVSARFIHKPAKASGKQLGALGLCVQPVTLALWTGSGLISQTNVITLSCHLLSLQRQLPDADEVLRDLSKSLLAFVSDEPRPVDEVLVYLFQCFLIVLA